MQLKYFLAICAAMACLGSSSAGGGEVSTGSEPKSVAVSIREAGLAKLDAFRMLEQMDPTQVDTFEAYGRAADQRVHGAVRAAKGPSRNNPIEPRMPRRPAGKAR